MEEDTPNSPQHHSNLPSIAQEERLTQINTLPHLRQFFAQILTAPPLVELEIQETTGLNTTDLTDESKKLKLIGDSPTENSIICHLPLSGTLSPNASIEPTNNSDPSFNDPLIMGYDVLPPNNLSRSNTLVHTTTFCHITSSKSSPNATLTNPSNDTSTLKPDPSFSTNPMLCNFSSSPKILH
ncbi:hypothetical protein HAX54_044381 [Datura stramonium]|uniref:Uncharacterized protein n=1 Tax=Datura stramonium TaxID=4076 RepID=A0ABS8SPE1_DATST|nr:hypothetical protein [Datura stramonium]